jgi:hypothetical protein
MYGQTVEDVLPSNNRQDCPDRVENLRQFGWRIAMKVSLSVSRKMSCTPFGSVSASAGVEIDLVKATPALVLEMALTNYTQLQALVEGQLVRHKEEVAREQIESSQDHSGRSNGQSKEGNDQQEEDQDLEDQDRNDPSVNAVALLAYSKEHNCTSQLFDLGRQFSLPRRFVDWRPDDTKRCYDILTASQKRNNRRRSPRSPAY